MAVILSGWWWGWGELTALKVDYPWVSSTGTRSSNDLQWFVNLRMNGYQESSIRNDHQATGPYMPFCTKRHDKLIKLISVIYLVDAYEFAFFLNCQRVADLPASLEYSLFSSSPPSAAYMRQWIVSIGSDKGLSPIRHQAITWINAGIVLIGPLGTIFNEFLFEIHNFPFKKNIWKCMKMEAILSRPWCVSGWNTARLLLDMIPGFQVI